MQSEYKLVPQTTAEHRCCLLPRIGHHIHPTNNLYNERQKVEAHVFIKLEEYSRRRSINFFHLTSISHIRRRLKRDIKDFSKQLSPYSISEEKCLQWIDEILERINSHLQTLIDSQNQLQQVFSSDEIFSSYHTNNQWQQLQLNRAKILFLDTNLNEKELLVNYQRYILKNLTPTKLEDDSLPLKSPENIHLDNEYHQAENVGREYLKKKLPNYKTRQYPNIDFLKIQFLFLFIQ